MARKKVTEDRDRIDEHHMPKKKRRKVVRNRKSYTKKKSGPEDKTKIKESIEECYETELLFLDYLFGEARFNASEAYRLATGKLEMTQAIRVQGYVYYHRLRPIIVKMLDEMGLSEEALKKKLIDLLNAKETKFFPYIKKITRKEPTSDGKVKTIKEEEQVVTEVEVESLSIQIDALKAAMKMRGMLSEKSSREVDQIDRLIEIELERLALARQGGDAGTAAKDEQPDSGEADT